MSSTTLAMIGIVVAILFGTAQVVVSYRPQPRRRSIAYWSVGTRLLGEDAKAVPLEVRVGGEVVKDPRLVAVHLVAYGGADIPSDAFDGHQDLVVELGAPVAHLVGSDGVEARWFTLENTALRLHPHLLKAGVHYKWDVVCDGPHRTTIAAPLIDTDTLDPREAYRRNSKADWIVRAAVTITGIALLVVGIANNPNDGQGDPEYGWYTYAFGAGLLLLIFGVSFLTVFRLSKQTRIADRLLRADLNYLLSTDWRR